MRAYLALHVILFTTMQKEHYELCVDLSYIFICLIIVTKLARGLGVYFYVFLLHRQTCWIECRSLLVAAWIGEPLLGYLENWSKYLLLC